MTKVGAHTPVSDAEAEDWARRMSEQEGDEAAVFDRDKWGDYVGDVFGGQTGLPLGDRQLHVLERGRQALLDTHLAAGLELRPSSKFSVISGEQIRTFRYADASTGRFISAEAAYGRLQGVGGSVPTLWRYK